MNVMHPEGAPESGGAAAAFRHPSGVERVVALVPRVSPGANLFQPSGLRRGAFAAIIRHFKQTGRVIVPLAVKDILDERFGHKLALARAARCGLDGERTCSHRGISLFPAPRTCDFGQRLHVGDQRARLYRERCLTYRLRKRKNAPRKPTYGLRRHLQRRMGHSYAVGMPPGSVGIPPLHVGGRSLSVGDAALCVGLKSGSVGGASLVFAVPHLHVGGSSLFAVPDAL